MAKAEPIEVRFPRHVNREGPTMAHMESPCWVWTASTDSGGYGHIAMHRRIWKAHRVAWMLEHNMEEPVGLDVCHRCDNRVCVRVDHLFVGTRSDNMQDCIRKGRRNDARGDANGSRLYPERLPKGTDHRLAKLTPEGVVEMRTLHRQGWSTKRLAVRFGVAPGTASCVLRRLTWRHVA